MKTKMQICTAISASNPTVLLYYSLQVWLQSRTVKLQCDT